MGINIAHKFIYIAGTTTTIYQLTVCIVLE